MNLKYQLVITYNQEASYQCSDRDWNFHLGRDRDEVEVESLVRNGIGIWSGSFYIVWKPTITIYIKSKIIYIKSKIKNHYYFFWNEGPLFFLGFMLMLSARSILLWDVGIFKISEQYQSENLASKLKIRAHRDSNLPKNFIPVNWISNYRN